MLTEAGILGGAPGRSRDLRALLSDPTLQAERSIRPDMIISASRPRGPADILKDFGSALSFRGVMGVGLGRATAHPFTPFIFDTPCDDPLDPPDSWEFYEDEVVNCSDLADNVDKHEPDCPPPITGCTECSPLALFGAPTLGSLYRPTGDECLDDDCQALLDSLSTAPADLEIDYTNNSSPDQDLEDLLSMAWNLLQQNSDIAEWVACLVEGKADGNCIERKLGNNQVLLLDENPPKSKIDDAPAWTIWASDKIHINTVHFVWDDLVGTLASSDPRDALCAVMQTASILLHELLHTCMTPRKECSAYAAGNSFLWAMAQRFPCFATGGESDAGSCNWYNKDCMWMFATGFNVKPDGC